MRRRRSGRLSRLSERTPLRVKLVAALLALASVAVVSTGAAATAVLRGYLVDRVDSQLVRYSTLALPYMTQPDKNPGTTPAGPITSNSVGSQPHLPTPYYLVTRDPDGKEIRRENAQLEREDAAPQLRDVTLEEARTRAGEAVTVPAIGKGQPDWRVRVIPLPDGDGTLTVALSMSDVDTTVSRLVRILFGVGLAVLTLIAGLAYAIVRRSLRPLREVERTAEAIAAGDLSRRVPDAPASTEVGRLSGAVNGMLAQIEAAFGDREASAEAARASEERMRRFITDASHELRTPLTSIRGFAELYRQGAYSSPERVPDLMRRIEEEATRMGLLVQDLLLLARLDQQRPLEREPVDLVAVATDTAQAARAADPSRRIEVRLLGDHDDPPGILGDDARLRQIAGNLVNNACIHTPPGTPVTVGVGTVVEGGQTWAVLDVADAGPGLTAEEAEHVFERFYRTDRSRARSTGGSGLGLSIVAALVAAHGGKVTVTSAPGQGALFRVRLPVDGGDAYDREPLPVASD